MQKTIIANMSVDQKEVDVSGVSTFFNLAAVPEQHDKFSQAQIIDL